MKKLMIMGLALAAGYAANAMSLDWKYTGTKSQVDYMAYIVLGTEAKTDWASAAEIAAAAAVLETDPTVSTAHKAVASSGGGHPTYSAAGSIKDADLTKSSSYYLVLVDKDKKQFAVSTVYAGDNVYDPDSQESGTLKTIGTGAMGTMQDFKSVPEPTSGLLLLLGVAGLALKRKRA